MRREVEEEGRASVCCVVTSACTAQGVKEDGGYVILGMARAPSPHFGHPAMHDAGAPPDRHERHSLAARSLPTRPTQPVAGLVMSEREGMALQFAGFGTRRSEKHAPQNPSPLILKLKLRPSRNACAQAGISRNITPLQHYSRKEEARGVNYDGAVQEETGRRLQVGNSSSIENQEIAIQNPMPSHPHTAPSWSARLGPDLPIRRHEHLKKHPPTPIVAPTTPQHVQRSPLAAPCRRQPGCSLWRNTQCAVSSRNLPDGLAERSPPMAELGKGYVDESYSLQNEIE